MFLEGTLVEKLRKLEALHAGTKVDGEREAARRAAERIRARLEELRGREQDVELLYRLPDPPIASWLYRFDRRRRSLADFGDRHASPKWRARHRAWQADQGLARRQKSELGCVSAVMNTTITHAMLSCAPSPSLGRAVDRRPVSIPTFTTDRGRVRLSRADGANAWLFGVLFDHMIRTEAAWAAPRKLAARLGHLDVHRIARMDEGQLGEVLRARPALHRLWPRLASSLRGTSQILIARYGGDAEQIWPDGLTVSTLRERLHRLPGLGTKLVNMTVRLLVDEFGRRYRGWADADIAPDRHVVRVFVRAGLVPAGARNDAVIAAARRLHPVYPAALDYPAFEIGRSFCHVRRPDCRHCPLRGACARRIGA